VPLLFPPCSQLPPDVPLLYAGVAAAWKEEVYSEVAEARAELSSEVADLVEAAELGASWVEAIDAVVAGTEVSAELLALCSQAWSLGIYGAKAMMIAMLGRIFGG
jgi:hypothetical protein